MSAVPRWYKPLKQIVDAIFRHDLSLRRDAQGVRVVLNDRANSFAPGRPSPAEGSVPITLGFEKRLFCRSLKHF